MAFFISLFISLATVSSNSPAYAVQVDILTSVPAPTPKPVPTIVSSPIPSSLAPTSEMAVAEITLMELEADLIRRLNEERVAAGLSALALDTDLVVIARIRSNDMADRGYFSHTSPEGQSAFTLLDQWGIPYSWAGENLARNNYPSAETVTVAVRDLMASPSHRANIFNPNYTRVGVGYTENNDGRHYYTVILVG
jgi:uncharacterized protein YkwD